MIWKSIQDNSLFHENDKPSPNWEIKIPTFETSFAHSAIERLNLGIPTYTQSQKYVPVKEGVPGYISPS